MKRYILLFSLFLGFYLQAQENIFLGRSFWKTNPSVEQVKQKIKEGNNPTEFNAFAFDAVCYAIISHAPTETIKYLLSLEGNEVDKKTHDGRNYLLWAGYAGDFDLVKHLIDKGSDVAWKDDHGFDLVSFTAYGCHTDPRFYELYKANGLDLKSSQRKGANALLLAAPSAKDISELDYFIKNGMHWNDMDDEGNNLVLEAASRGNVKLIEQLIEKGIDFKINNNSNENAILKAATGGRRHVNDIEIFKYLTDLGLNPKQENNEQENALHYLAVNNPNWEVFEFFIAKGVNPNASSEKGFSPYLVALKYNNLKVIDKLFELNKYFDQSTKDGHNALSYAVMHYNFDQFNALKSKSVDYNVLNENNESLMNLLFQNYPSGNMKKFQQFLAILTQENVKPTISTDKGNTLFHIIVNNNQPELLPFAKNLRVDIDQMNAEGLTPLHLAAMKSTDLKMLKALKQMGANARINTEFGEDAAVLALENELLDVNLSDLSFLEASSN